MNRFRKAIRHCKKNINESPTNSMGGIYALNAPGFRVGKKDRELKFYADVDGNYPTGVPGQEGDPFYLRPEGYWSGGSDWDETLVPDASQEFLINDPTGKDTSDLIAEDGTVKTFLPPDSRSFILGPLVDGYVLNHGNDNFTNIGYIQKDTRQFVLLARTQGQITANLHTEGGRVWDGTADQLTIYNSSFTLAMAEWFRDKILEESFTKNVPYFYSGGVPQQPQTPAECPNCPPNMFGGVTPGTGGGFGSGGDPNIGTQQGPPTSGNQVQANIFNLTPDQQRTLMNATMLGLDIVAVLAVLFPEPSSSAAGAVHLATKFRYAAKLTRALSKLNPFKSSPKPKITYKNKPTKAKYGDSPKSKPTPEQPKYNPKEPGGGKEYQAAARNFQRQNPGKYNPYRSDSANKLMKQQGVGTKPSQNPKFGKSTKFNNSYEYDFNNILLEQIINYSLFETAATGSGLGGGMEVADNYVNSVSETSSPEELEQASNDANDIAKEGGKGLSDSDLAKIDKDAEAEAKRLTNVNVNNPESMDDDQLFSSLDSIYEMNQDWFNDTMDKLDPLIPQSELDKLGEEYEEKETARETARETIQGEIDEIDKNYDTWGGGSWEENGVRIEGSVNWGAQFTKQNFESSGQSFEEYNALRAQLGFFNGDSGPDEYGRYYPGGWESWDAREKGYRPEQFTGVLYEIVSRSYKMDEIKSNKNFPQPGQNIYYTEADYNEAVYLQDEYGKIFAEYVNLYEGPGGFDDLRGKLWDFENRSRELMKQDARDARKRRDGLEFQLSNLGGSVYDQEYEDRFNKIFRPFLITFIKEWNEFNQGEDMNDDPYSLKNLTPGEIANMSEADKKRLKSYLSKMGVSYGDIAYAAAGDRITGGLAELILGGGAVVIGALGSLYNMTSTQVQNLYNAATTVVPDGESSQQAQEREASDKKLADAESQYGPDSDEAAEARRERSDTLTRHKRERRGGKSTSGDAKKQKEAEQEAAKRAREERLRRNQEATKRENEGKIRRSKEKERKGKQRTDGDDIQDLLRGETYNPPKFIKNRERKSLTETRTPKQKKILREIKQPIKVKEAPTKYKMNFSGKFSAQNTPDKTASAQSDALVASGNAKGQKWRQQDKYWAGYETTERMNIIHDRVGHGKQAWDMILDEAKKKNGWRDKEMQEELNKIAHERAMLKENPDYASPFGNVEVSTTEKNLQNFEKVNKIKKVVSDKKVFSNKEIKPEYPEEDKESKQRRLGTGRPPELTPDDEMIKQNRYGDMSSKRGKIQKGYEHEKLNSGERASAYYKRLDPISADSMPDAAYPQINDFRNKARKKTK